MMIFDLQPTLENNLILLRPLNQEDYDSLYQVAKDPLIWEQHPWTDPKKMSLKFSSMNLWLQKELY